MNQKGIAALFPGQASQYVGMGKALFDSFPQAAAVIDRAHEAAGFDLRSCCFEGPAEKLALTEFQQPCVLACSVAVYEVLKSETDLDTVCAAGHSLGEYSALVAAGSISLEAAVALVRTRGRLMQEAVSEVPGGMAALIGRGEIDAEGLCAEASDGDDACFPANMNCPGQVVISGSITALDRAAGIAKGYGARRVVRLNVSAPFHSPYMNNAAERFSAHIDKIRIEKPTFDVYSNVTGDLHSENTEKIKKALIAQMNSPVLFEDIGRLLSQREDVDFGVECGPGNVLTGLMARISSEMRVVPFGEPDHLINLKEQAGQ